MNDDIIHGQENPIVLKLKYITPTNLESYKWLLIETSLEILGPVLRRLSFYMTIYWVKKIVLLYA
jgi:hypothetical protein